MQQATVIVGLGYVGLPVAMRATAAGHRVIGVDLSENRVQMLHSGRSYVEDVDSTDVGAAIAAGSLVVTTSYDTIDRFDTAVITVPTPLRESLPDLSFIESAARGLAPHIERGSTVVLESTTYPGTTEELLLPLLEKGSGLVAGTDFFVGYSPERIDPGNEHWTLRTTPKVVSGINAASLDAVRSFYSDLVERTVAVSGTREAELTKLLENTFRHVNIALVNELTVFAKDLGVDIWEAIDAASTKPFGYMPFRPGPGVGGHCLPVDPSYLSWQVKKTLGRSFRFIELANDVNDHMPDYVLQRIVSNLNSRGLAVKGARITLVGLAYKRNTGDVRESPAMRLVELLEAYGALLTAVDDYVLDTNWPNNVGRVASGDLASVETDLIVVVTDHDQIDYDALSERGTAVFDTRHRVPTGVEYL